MRPSLSELVRRYDVPGPRYTSYPTAPEWSSRVGPHSLAAALETAGRMRPEEPLSLYIHLPFCRALCRYCGCNVVITHDHDKIDAYLRRLRVELGRIRARLGARGKLAQLHLGGGTPTSLDLGQLDRLLNEVSHHFEILPDAEQSVEVDPRVTSADQLALLRRHGFNRLSAGVQDLDPKVQEAIGRSQSVDQTRAVLETARALGFSGVNFDLIYGLPEQTEATWRQTLEQVVRLRPDRLAIYSFAFVPELRPQQKLLALYPRPSGTEKLALIDLAHRILQEAGYVSIGMDHFALPDDELVVAQRERRLWRNFQGYSVCRANDVIAAGSSAISDVNGVYAQNDKSLDPYYAAIDSGGFATERGAILSADDLRRRDVITQLLCNFWVDLGPDGPRAFQPELLELRERHQADGLVEIAGSEISLTPIGRSFARNVAMVFDAYLRRSPATQRFSRTV